ncbi:MAG: hypothetical protein L0Y60_14365 [Beijerinckiaceae bacterium]|nr:hypothetical protein [Beijerinckiaceae bacterium]
MTGRNGLDRVHLAGHGIDRIPKLCARAAYAKQAIREKLIEQKLFVAEHGTGIPDIRDWRRPHASGAASPAWANAHFHGNSMPKASSGRGPQSGRPPIAAIL